MRPTSIVLGVALALVVDCPLSRPDRLSFAQIGAGMARAAKGARACAKRPLKTRSGMVVQTSVDVARSGRVTKVRFYKHDRVGAPLKRCIRRAIFALRFPRFCKQSGFSAPLR